MLVVALPDDEPAKGTGAVDRARAFLEAVRDKEIDRAFELVGVDRPADDEGGRLIDPRAMALDWTIGEVTPSREDPDIVNVAEYTLESGDRSVSGSFLFSEYGDRWVLSNPTVEVSIPYSPLRYLEVGDLRVPRAFEAGSSPTFQLLPGLYSFFDSHSPRSTEPLFLAPERGYTPPPEITPFLDGWPGDWAEIRRQVKVVVDACVQQTQLMPPGCPFGTDDLIPFDDGDNLMALTDIADIRWTVDLPAKFDDLSAGEWRNDSMRLANIESAAVLTGTGAIDETRRVSFTAYCLLRLSMLAVGESADGTLVVDDFNRRYPEEPKPIPRKCTHSR